MKRYENPLLNVSLFDAENIITASGETPEPEMTAIEKAQADAAKRHTAGVITVTF